MQKSRGIPLGLDIRFEVALVTRLVTGGSFGKQVLPLLDGDALAFPPARLLLETLLATRRAGEEIPRTTLQALQRLSRRVDHKGDCTAENVREVANMFASAQIAGLPDDDALITELRPVLRKRATRDQLNSALEASALGNDVVFSNKRIDDIDRLGTRTSETTRWGASALDVIEAAGSLEQLSTGVQEIDDMLDGGKPRGTLTVYCADSGGGKSMALAQEATAGLISSAFVGFATVELPKAIQFARMMACLTGIPTKTIQNNPKAPHLQSLIASYTGMATFGALAMTDMDPKRTDPAAIFDWVKEQEQIEGRAMDLLVVDYADKLIPHARGGQRNTGRDVGGYEAQGDVYDQLYTWARDGNRWLTTASQAGRRPDGGTKKKILTGHNVADSLNKLRTSDIFITLNPESDGLMRARLDKFRLGEGDKTSSPFPRDFACSRVGPFPLAEALLAMVRSGGVRDILLPL